MSDIDSALAALDQPMADSKPAKAPKLSASLKKLLPAQPPVVEVSGISWFVDQENGRLCASRVGVPCFDKQGALKAMHGAFADVKSCSTWIDWAHAHHRISDADKDAAEELLAIAHRSDRLTNYQPQKAAEAARPKIRSTSPAPKAGKSSSAGGKYKAVALKEAGEVEISDTFTSVGHYVDKCCQLAPESNLHRFEVVLHSGTGHAAVKRLPHASKAVQKLFTKRLEVESIQLDEAADAKNEPWVLLVRSGKSASKRKAEQQSEAKPAVTKKPKKKKKDTEEAAVDCKQPKAKKPKKAPADKTAQQGSTPLIIQPVVLHATPKQQQQPAVKLTMAAVAAMAAQASSKKHKPQ